MPIWLPNPKSQLRVLSSKELKFLSRKVAAVYTYQEELSWNNWTYLQTVRVFLYIVQQNPSIWNIRLVFCL